jgi:hypothetical protein
MRLACSFGASAGVFSVRPNRLRREHHVRVSDKQLVPACVTKSAGNLAAEALQQGELLAFREENRLLTSLFDSIAALAFLSQGVVLLRVAAVAAASAVHLNRNLLAQFQRALDQRVAFVVVGSILPKCVDSRQNCVEVTSLCSHGGGGGTTPAQRWRLHGRD